MINSKVVYRLIFLFALLLSAPLQALQLNNPDNALKQYVDYQDNMFNMQHIVSLPGAGFTAHLYNLTSQEWLTDANIDRSVWTHSLVMIIPDVVTSKTSLLYVGEGKNTDPLPDATHPVVNIITQLALGSQSIVSAVFQIPNQPIVFDDNGIPTKEDKLVAISWKNASNTGNYVNSVYLPMVKSVVRAMDGIQAVAPDHGNLVIDDFILTGFSKRGATVWLTAAVDKRIKAIAPGVIDFLNVIPSFEHHFKSYGTFSTAVQDYVDLGITDELRTPEFEQLAKVVDPFNYIDQLTMPKFMLNSPGDQFFLPDSSRFYYDDLMGEKLIRFAPNTDHSLSNSVTGVQDSLFSLLGWYQSVLYNVPRPSIKWSVTNNQLMAQTDFPPQAVKVWTAFNATGRDFRKETIGESWVSTILPVNSTGEYTVALPSGNEGFHASYIEFIYSGPTGLPVSYSTQVFVTPDQYPFTLEQPVFNPGSATYWTHQVKALLYGKAYSQLDEATFLAYLPIPLFGDFIRTLDDASDTLSINSIPQFSSLARRECLATRLNIKAGETGWYSQYDLGLHLGNKPLWEHYRLAHENIDNLPFLSSYICYQLNHR